MTGPDNPISVMLNAAPVCGSVWTREGRSVDCNGAALRFFGLDSKQAWLEHYGELSPEYQPGGEASGPLLLAHLNEAFADGSAEFAWLHRRLDGRIVPTQVTLTRVRVDGDERVVAYVVEQSADHTRDARARLVLDNAPLACTFWNARGAVIDCNLESLRLFDVGSKQEYLARFAEFMPEYQPDGSNSLERVKYHVNLALELGRVTMPIPWMRQTAAGEPIPCELTLVRVVEDNEPMVVAFLRDLREEGRLQAEGRTAEERMQIMLDATPLGCSLWDEESRLVDCNQEAVRLFGLTSKQEFLDRFFELSPLRQPDGQLTADKHPRNIQEAHRLGYVRLEWLHCTLAGEMLPVELTLVRVQRAQGHVIAAYIRDLREVIEVLGRIREANEYAQLMLDATPLCCSLWNEEHELIACNQETVKLFELGSKQEFLERFFALSPEYQPSERPSRELAYEHIGVALRDGYTRFEWMHQKLNGEPVPAEITLVRVPRGDGYIVAGYMRDLREIKESVASLKRLEELAYTDKLTCAANRHYFMEHAPYALGQLSPGGSASLLIFDIDHFKRVNDTHGHSAGDVILQGVADRVRKSLRPNDLFARYGGEEFVILLARARLDGALIVAERVREIIARTPFEYQDQTIEVTVSIGVTTCSHPAPPLQNLIDQADAALYQAKHRGRNRVERILPAE